MIEWTAAGAATDPAPPAWYLELAPLPDHAPWVHHLYLRYDPGQPIGAQPRLFASPFRDLGLWSVPDGRSTDRAASPMRWQPFDRPAQFGWRPRRRPGPGWVIGWRGPPFAAVDATAWPRIAQAMPLPVPAAAGRPVWCDALVQALDQGIGQVIERTLAAGDGWQTLDPAALPAVLAGPAAGRVRLLAAALAVSPRTLQRRMGSLTGLPPKRWLALWRFSTAIHTIALSREGLAETALAAGYADQAHLTLDFRRHAAMPPGRFRALARRQVIMAGGRFFQDPALAGRLRFAVLDR